jgi:hypothetical protein
VNGYGWASACQAFEEQICQVAATVEDGHDPDFVASYRVDYPPGLVGDYQVLEDADPPQFQHRPATLGEGLEAVSLGVELQDDFLGMDGIGVNFDQKRLATWVWWPAVLRARARGRVRETSWERPITGCVAAARPRK